jgi:hypothetical protein
MSGAFANRAPAAAKCAGALGANPQTAMLVRPALKELAL